jgi:hypothetical protein
MVTADHHTDKRRARADQAPLQAKIVFHPTLDERRPSPQRTFFGSGDTPGNWLDRQQATRAQFLASSDVNDVPKELQDYHMTGGFGYPLAVNRGASGGAAGIGLPSQDILSSVNRWVETVSSSPGTVPFRNLILGGTPAQRYTIRQRAGSGTADMTEIVRVMVDDILSWGNAQFPALTDGTNCRVANDRIPFALIWDLILVGNEDVTGNRINFFDNTRLINPPINQLPSPRANLDRISRINTDAPYFPTANYIPFFETVPNAGWQPGNAIPFFFNRMFLELPYLTNPILQIL